MCHSPLLSLFSLVLKLSHVYQCETFHTSSRVLCYSPLMLPCFLVGDVPGSPGALPAPTWNQLFYRILPVGLILSFPADKQLHILSPCSSHNLIFFPPYLLSWSFIICMSTDGSLSLAAGGEKRGVGEGKETKTYSKFGDAINYLPDKKKLLFS